MNDWLTWNGERSTDMGVYVIRQPPITIPDERVEFDTVKGRSGTLPRTEGDAIYNDMILPAECFIRDPEKVSAAIAWLRGSGSVEFANRPGGHYRARIVNQIELERVLAGNPHRRFTVNFRCQPGWIHDGVTALQPITASGTKVENPGTLPALPRIEIRGSGTFSVSFGQQTAWLSDLTDGIILDSEVGDALTLDGSALMNGNWGGPIIRLQPGTTFVSWLVEDGAVESVTITEPRWMSL